ncbi:MAG: triose-phosphate isomerase [Chlamydiales bacterium]|nr:triose-phosphate isomerase [Chlamydiales bacterium]
MSRGVYVIGNWKMYKTAREATDYIEELDPALQKVATHVYLAVPFTSIAAAARLTKRTNLVIGAQNMNDAREGAFTGEISALMLKEAGAEFVILGHSERRRVFGESNAFIHQKVIRALKDELQPVVCIGEDLEEREAGRTEEVLKSQIDECLASIPATEMEKVLIAYEPVWAIGTGKSASPEMAGKAHAFCRSCLSELFGEELSEKIPILYGGSVKSETASAIVMQPDIDGVLVGGASTDPKEFSKIVLNCESAK